MTVDITQDEMNILNLNGISADEVKSNVEFMRASGYDDKTIRQSYDNTLNELRPITKVSVNDTQRINEYNKKGAIAPYEFAQRKAVEYNGTYDNISKQKLTPRDISIRERIERDRQKKLERNKRVNEGTGSFFDRAGAFMDRMGDSAYQSEKQRAELNEHRQQPNKDNPNYRYEVSGVNRAGQPIYTEIDKTKKIGFNEALKESILTGGFVPYVGGFLEKGDEAKERDIRERILEGKEIRQDELDFLNYRLDRKQEELLRGYTIGGQIANGFLPSVFRLGAEMATGGWVLKSLGLAPELAEDATIWEKVAHGIKTMLGSGTVGALLPTSWNDTYATYQDMRSDKELIPTETGNWIFKESEEKPATSFLKSLGQTFSMFAAEGSGELIGLGLNGVGGAASKYVGSPIGAYLMRNAKLNKLYNTVVPAMAKAYEKMNGLPVIGKNTDWLKKAVKYDGLLEEMGEEALEDVLNLTLGATDDKRTLENYAKAVFKSPDEWAVIAGAVLLQGATLSATSHILGSQLERSGMSDEQIVETLNNLTPEEQREEVEKMIEEGIITLPEYSNENLQKIDKLKDNFYNQLKNAGMDDAESLSNADISADVIAKTAQDFGIDVDELNHQFGIDIQNLTDEEAYEQYQNDNIATLQGRVEQNAYADSDEYWLDKAEEYEGVNEEDDLLFQSASSAGAGVNDITDAQKEWEEKGTDSKYFKAWFGDSKVVDSEGNPLLVYHGTKNGGFEEFDSDKSNYGYISTGFNFFTNKKLAYPNSASDYAGKGGQIYETYLSIKKPLEIGYRSTPNDEYYSPIQFWDYNQSYIRREYRKGNYDGIIIYNEDKENDDSVIYLVPNSEQIKSVDNRGTFDSNSGNIYYQSMIAGIDGKQEVDVVDLSGQFSSDSTLTKKDLSAYIKTLIGNVNNLTDKDKKAIFDFVKKSKRIGKKDVYVPDHIAGSSKVENQYKGERNTFVNNILDLLENSTLIDVEKNTDKNKPNVDNYLRFYVPVKIGSDIYTVRVVAENNTGKNLFNILNADVYDVIVDKKMTASSPSTKGNLAKQSSNNIVPQNDENITSDKVTIEDMLRGVLDPDKKPYFQSMTQEELLSTYLNQEFGMNTQEITDMVKEDVLRIMDEAGVNTDEFNYEDIRVYGSYSKGTNKKGSDLDIIVQYSGNMSEDSAFNILHSEDLAIYDKQGNKVKIDINPINKVDHGTIDDYSKILFQGVNKNNVENKNNSKLTDEDKSNIQKFKDFVDKVLNRKKELSNAEKSRPYIIGNTPAVLQEVGISNNKLSIGLKAITKAQAEKNNDHKLSQKTISNVLEELYRPIVILKDKVKDSEKNNPKDRYSVILDLHANNGDYVLVGIESERKTGNAILNDIRSIHSRNDFYEQIEEALGDGRLLKVDQKKIKDLLNHNQSGSPEGVTSLIDSIIEKDKSVNGGILFQEEEENVEPNSTEEGIKNARGFTYETELADSVKNMIVLLKNKKDKSTYIHEFAHVYLNVLNRLAKTNSKAQDRLNTINKWLRYDGRGEYTTAQHEKFANGFVAYIKQGKAPTYGLKKAFEHFKKWLNDIYVALDNHSEFIMDSEAKAVFDEILGGTEHDKQLQKGIELYNRAISYAEIKSAEKAEREKLKPVQLSDYQNRFMNTAYDIIYYALQHHPEGKELVKNRQQLVMILGRGKKKTFYRKSQGVVSQFEQIENILSESGDVFSSNDGFLSEWGEFFKPLSEEYTDSDLALDALDTITEERYLYPAFEDDIESLRYGGALTEKTIQETQYIFDYIVDEYRDAKDKTIPLLAWNEFHSHIHPYIIDDFEKKWESETAEIDRYQSLSKMQQAKEDLKLYAAALKGHGDYHGQFVEYATKILDKLDFMTIGDKEKIIKKIGEFGTFRDIERNLDDVMDYAETLQAVTERRMIADSIQREVKQTIHEWKNGIKKTKYTYPANKLFERLRELNRMTQEQVQDIYDEFVNEESTPDYVSDDVNNEDYYKTIEKMFVQFKANGMYYNSTAFLKELLDRIQFAKFTAKVARDEIDFERRMQQIHYVDKCAQALNNRKTEIKENNKIKFLSNLNAFGFNFNGALRMIFNDNIKNWASLDYLYARKDGQVGKDRREFLNKAKSIFGFEGKKGDIQLQSKFIDMTKKEFTITQRHSPDIEKGSYRVTENNKETGYNPTVQTQQVRLNQSSEIADEWKPIEVELSRMEVLYYYIQAKNPTSWTILTDDEKGQFKRADFENLLEELTPEEKLLGDLMQLSAEKYWDALNAYHIKKYHTELGKVKNYFPRLSESQEVNMLEMFNDFSQYSGTGKFQKQRTAGPGTRIASANALAVLFDHMERANTIVIMGEHLDLINKVFKNPDLKRLLENTWGEKVSQEFYGQLTGNLFTGQSAVKSLQEKWYQKVVGNLVKTNLFLKPQIGIKQLISFMNYGKGDDYVSAGEWLKAFAKQTLTPSEWKKNIEFMMSNEYMADRFSRGGSMDALKKELENKFFAKINLFDEFWSLPIQLGDIGAIILGGKPYIDVLMNKGYSKEEAFKIFIETTVNDQQSSIPSTLSNAQRNASKQPFSKMFFAYQNTPWQYYRQCTSAIMNAVQSGKTKDIKRASKMVLLYGWIFPAIFNMASSLSPLALVAGGDDDDLLNDINPLRTLTSLLTQHPIVGDWINGILNAIDDKGFYSNDLLTKHVKSVNKLIRDTKKGELTLKDIWDATCAFVEPSTGLPVGSAGNAVSGMYDMTQGDFLKGVLKAFGYSEYRAKSVTGEE